jgi:uncharacterized protein YerC
MVTYPISVKRNGYRGANPKRRAKAYVENEIASALEQHINKRLLEQTQPVRVYLYHEIARETGYNVETVGRLCFSIDGGHNGFTAIKRGMTLDQAMAAMHGNAPNAQ